MTRMAADKSKNKMTQTSRGTNLASSSSSQWSRINPKERFSHSISVQDFILSARIRVIRGSLFFFHMFRVFRGYLVFLSVGLPRYPWGFLSLVGDPWPDRQDDRDRQQGDAGEYAEDHVQRHVPVA